MNGFKKKAISLGAEYLTGEVIGFQDVKDKNNNFGPTKLDIKTESGEVKSLQFSECVIATGYESGAVGNLAGIGTGNGLLEFAIPVEPK